MLQENTDHRRWLIKDGFPLREAHIKKSLDLSRFWIPTVQVAHWQIFFKHFLALLRPIFFGLKSGRHRDLRRLPCTFLVFLLHQALTYPTNTSLLNAQTDMQLYTSCKQVFFCEICPSYDAPTWRHFPFLFSRTPAVFTLFSRTDTLFFSRAYSR